MKGDGDGDGDGRGDAMTSMVLSWGFACVIVTGLAACRDMPSMKRAG